MAESPRDTGAILSDREVAAKYRAMRDRIAPMRAEGYHLAPEMLERYLDNTGQIAWIDPPRLRGQLEVRDAEARLREYFRDWLTGPTGWQYEQIADQLRNLPEGATLPVRSRWEAKLHPDDPSTPLKLAVRPRSATDLYGAIGQSLLEAMGDFRFQRRGDEIPFSGTVNSRLRDRYDFDSSGKYPVPARQGIWPTEELKGDEFTVLEDYGMAQPFDLRSEWLQDVTGSLGVDSEGNFYVKSFRWTDHLPRAGRGAR